MDDAFAMSDLRPPRPPAAASKGGAGSGFGDRCQPAHPATGAKRTEPTAKHTTPSPRHKAVKLKRDQVESIDFVEGSPDGSDRSVRQQSPGTARVAAKAQPSQRPAAGPRKRGKKKPAPGEEFTPAHALVQEVVRHGFSPEQAIAALYHPGVATAADAVNWIVENPLYFVAAGAPPASGACGVLLDSPRAALLGKRPPVVSPGSSCASPAGAAAADAPPPPPLLVSPAASQDDAAMTTRERGRKNLAPLQLPDALGDLPVVAASGAVEQAVEDLQWTKWESNLLQKSPLVTPRDRPSSKGSRKPQLRVRAAVTPGSPGVPGSEGKASPADVMELEDLMQRLTPCEGGSGSAAVAAAMAAASPGGCVYRHTPRTTPGSGHGTSSRFTFDMATGVMSPASTPRGAGGGGGGPESMLISPMHCVPAALGTGPPPPMSPRWDVRWQQQGGHVQLAPARFSPHPMSPCLSLETNTAACAAAIFAAKGPAPVLQKKVFTFGEEAVLPPPVLVSPPREREELHSLGGDMMSLSEMLSP